MMEEKIETVINKRADFSIGKISDLIRNRLSLFKLFMLYDEVELNNAKLKAELFVQHPLQGPRILVEYVDCRTAPEGPTAG